MSIDAVVVSNVVEEEVILDELVDRESYGKYTGSTKWFNDKLGYGFITICDGDEKGKDIFVHHSGVKPLNSNYKTLRKGEYIQFNIINGMNGLQAVDVTGIKGGPLMCDYVTSKRIGYPPSAIPVEYMLRGDFHRPPPPPPQFDESVSSDWKTIPVRKAVPMPPHVHAHRGKKQPHVAKYTKTVPKKQD